MINLRIQKDWQFPIFEILLRHLKTENIELRINGQKLYLFAKLSQKMKSIDFCSIGHH